MKHTDEGLQLNKHEITALLAFASESPENLKLYGVQFTLTASKVRARASNGHIALDALGENDSGLENEWFVHRDFLRGAHKALENSDVLHLRFSGASLHDGNIVDADGNVRSTFSWPHDAANTQMTFPDGETWSRLLAPPEGKRTVRFVTLNPEYLALLSKVAKAAGSGRGIDCYPPPKADDHCLYRIEGTETTWVAVIMPMRSDDPDQEIDDGPFAALSNAMPEGTTATMTVGDKSVEIAKGRKKR